MRRLVLLPLIAGCGGDQLLFLSRPWDADRTAVLVALSGDGPIGSPSISSGEKLEMSVDADPPFSIFAWVFAQDRLSPSCAIALGGEGFAVPSAENVWEARVTDVDRAPAFQEVEAPALDLKTTCSVPLPCPTATVEDHPIPELAGNIVGIVPLSTSRALISADQGPRIFDFEAGQRRQLDTTAFGEWIRTLARSGDTVYGSTRSLIFRFDLSDEIIEVQSSLIQKGLEPVPGGAPLVYGDFGIREVFGAQSGTTAIERIAIDVRHLRVVTPANAMLVDEVSTIHAFAGGGWLAEDPGNGGFTVESLRRVDGDESSFMAIGKRENAFLKKDGLWEQLPPALNRGISFNDVASLGNDRFFVVGEFGTGALWQEGIWCTYDLIRDRSVQRIVKTEDPNVLFAGTNPDSEGAPHLLRITLE